MKTIYFGLLVGCLVTLLLRYKRLPSYCLWFIPLIALGFIAEWMKDAIPYDRNSIQRIYQLLECLLLFCFYHQIFKSRFNKRLTKILYLLFVAIVVFYYEFYRHTLDVRDYFDYTLESFFICLLVSIFFLELLQYRGEMNLATFAAFWINAVNLLFYGGNFFAMALYERIGHSNTSLGKEVLQIPFYLNLFLYSAYLLIFVLARKKDSDVY